MSGELLLGRAVRLRHFMFDHGDVDQCGGVPVGTPRFAAAWQRSGTGEAAPRIFTNGTNGVVRALAPDRRRPRLEFACDTY